MTMGRRWLGVAVLALAAGACRSYRAPPFQTGPREEEPFDRHFTVIGDLQRTSPFEVWRENNDAERLQLLPGVASTNPAFVVMVGDLVALGSSSGSWREFDERARDLQKKRIPVLPVPGNHDYWGGGGLQLYFDHFPGLHGQRWFERRYGPLGLIFLDSNADPLGQEEWNAERGWYEAALDRFERDDHVRAVLVFLHHPPFTNSTIVEDDANVRSAFVAPFLSKQKTLAMMSGHAHGYERFERQGKAFIVTAGGGGPRGPLLCGDERRHSDDLFGGPRVRHFNFVELNVEPRGLHAYVLGLPKGGHDFCRMEEFDLPWPHGVDEDMASPAARPRHDLPDCYRAGQVTCDDGR